MTNAKSLASLYGEARNKEHAAQKRVRILKEALQRAEDKLRKARAQRDEAWQACMDWEEEEPSE